MLGRRSLAQALTLVMLASTIVTASAPSGGAAFPGRNGWIYGSSGGTIYRWDPETGARENLGTGMRPNVSADGTKVVFEDQRGIWTMDQNGQGRQLLVDVGYAYPAWSPDGQKIAATKSTGDLVALDATSAQETVIHPAEAGGSVLPSWSPDGTRIAFMTGGFPATVPAAGGEAVVFPEAASGTVDWSPDSTRVHYTTFSPLGPETWRASVTSRTPTGAGPIEHWSQEGSIDEVQTGRISRMAVSPDGTRWLTEKGQDELWITDTAGNNILELTPTPFGGAEFVWGPASMLEVSVEPFDLEGQSLDKELTLDQNFIVDVTLKNGTSEDLHDVEFAFGKALEIDDRSPGGIVELSGPGQDLPSTLTAGEERTFTFELTAFREGIAAVHTKITATTEDDAEVEAWESLKLEILEGQVVTEELRRMIILDAVDKYFQRAFVDFYNQLKKRANKLKRKLGRNISDRAKRIYFGPGGKLVTLFGERVEAAQRATPPELVGASTPNRKFKGHTVKELNAAYDQSFKKELGKGVKEWAKNWKHLGAAAKKFAKDSWTESLLAGKYAMGNATPEERAQFEVMAMTLLDESNKDFDNLYTELDKDSKTWVIDVILRKAAEAAAIKRTFDDVTLQSKDLEAQLEQERTWRSNMLKLAETDPVRFQQEWAKRDAEIANLGVPLILDTFMGGGVTRIGTTAKKIKIVGKGTAVIRGGEASGVIKPNGKVVKGPKSGITQADSPGVSGTEIAQLERTTDEFLSNVDGATVVRSSDQGTIYELPNIGGVPEITLDAKAGILGELEAEYLATTGKSLELAEILKPSSALRKPGGVAKLELTSTKTGKTTMLDGGMPDAALAEANVWINPTHPTKLPGFNKLSKSRQAKAVDEWKKANQRWDDYHNPAPGSKEEKLRQCIGQRARVPLDDQPNSAGLQRFVTAEFEEVLVTQGDSKAKLIRVKHYEVEVFDHNAGKAVNRKTVVDNLPEGSAQTADADAVGVAKVVGKTPEGKPILEPLSRSEREFLMQRYIDKNIKARRSGLIPDSAEHGVTLVMDDASAKAAGKLLPNYGVPFLPEAVARRYLRRIAPWVKGGADISDAEMLEKMLKIIQSEGGFGQHAIVLTRDSRYLGALEVAAW